MMAMNFRYHRWMRSTELQELTASEPLTLQEEYAMQQSWRDDDDSKNDGRGVALAPCGAEM